MLTYLEKCNKTVLYPIELGTYNVKIGLGYAALIVYQNDLGKTIAELLDINDGTFKIEIANPDTDAIIIAPSTEPTYADHSYIWVTNSSKIAAILKK